MVSFWKGRKRGTCKAGVNQCCHGGKTGRRIRLRDMRKNQKGRVAAIKQGGELGKRLRDMGLVPGTEITVQKRAPLYDPVALRVMGGVVSLRNNEADFIEVDVEEEGEAA